MLQLSPYLFSLPLFPQKTLPYSSSSPQWLPLFTVSSMSTFMNHSICFSFPSSLHFPLWPPINSSTWSKTPCALCAHEKLSFQHSDIWLLNSPPANLLWHSSCHKSLISKISHLSSSVSTFLFFYDYLYYLINALSFLCYSRLAKLQLWQKYTHSLVSADCF